MIRAESDAYMTTRTGTACERGGGWQGDRVDGADGLKKLWEEKKLKKKEEMLEWQDEQLNKER